ncbi:MAG: winged helix-turn-helix domain-containing protein [Promethearchaeota archaeon]
MQKKISCDSSYSVLQIQILHILMDAPYRQNKLQKELQERVQRRITPQNLSYHLNILERDQLIEKKIVAQIGNARINEICLNSGQLQHIRKLLDIEITNFTLITGFGKLTEGYRIPDVVCNSLQQMKIEITRIVCFTSPDARKVRENKEKTEILIPIDQYHDQYEYEADYCNLDSLLYQEDLDRILRKELKDANLILDLTPMSKLFSFKMLELANRYQLPCFFLGKSKNQSPHLIWMSGMKLEGKMNAMGLSIK